ncbi:MAG: class I SAM-dependent methyltransferase [Deltaproteobacteria bacterium]|nr:class I SAM-dependent methyltransferase [Deltaproteobacteria bacterium]MBW2723215.1 class I SAM-dependent methyltransferase [Deltaproteobacteria bacterium]
MATDDADSPEEIERTQSIAADELDDDREGANSAQDSRSAPSCPVCESPDSVVYLEGDSMAEKSEATNAESAGANRSDERTGTVLRCKQCKLGFRESRPDEAALAKFYQEQDVEPYLSEIAGRRWTARRHWELVKPLMLRGHVLDVGCGSGLFLEQVGRAGWTGTGIEPSPALCDHARKRMSNRVNIICGTLESSGFPPRLFDVVTLWDVLEYTPRPADCLRESSVPLKPGGYVLLNVPYIDSSSAQFLGRSWPLLRREHLNYFSRESLLRCAHAAGLTLERFGRRSAIFSLGYLMRRLAEREIPLASGLLTLFSNLNIEEWLVPVPLGEIVAIYRKPEL